MIEPDLQQTLSASVQEVLEKMFFFSPPETPCAPVTGGEAEIAARVEFSGNPPGELSLRLNLQAARSISADFLAVEAHDLDDDQVAGVICELANMICGAALSRVESTSLFRLGTPYLIPRADTGADAASGRASYTIEMFGGALSVAMSMDTACTLTAE